MVTPDPDMSRSIEPDRIPAISIEALHETFGREDGRTVKSVDAVLRLLGG